ncbi:MAG: hypothetical protein WDM87_13455 [Terracidiphilus sp.]
MSTSKFELRSRVRTVTDHTVTVLGDIGHDPGDCAAGGDLRRAHL